MTAVDSNMGLEERREYFFKYLRISACVFLLGQNFFAYNFRSKLRLCVCGLFFFNVFIYSDCPHQKEHLYHQDVILGKNVMG